VQHRARHSAEFALHSSLRAFALHMISLACHAAVAELSVLLYACPSTLAHFGWHSAAVRRSVALLMLCVAAYAEPVLSQVSLSLLTASAQQLIHGARDVPFFPRSIPALESEYRSPRRASSSALSHQPTFEAWSLPSFSAAAVGAPSF
jgi:hypothetical protein